MYVCVNEEIVDNVCLLAGNSDSLFYCLLLLFSVLDKGQILFPIFVLCDKRAGTAARCLYIRYS